MHTFKLAAIFSDHMILQRDKQTTIFGYGKSGSTVQVVLSKSQEIICKSPSVIKDGRWSVQLPPQPAGTGYRLFARCDNKSFTYDDIVFGEVWIAGGQSNMEFELQNCAEVALNQDILSAPNSKVRFYYTPKMSYIDNEFYQTEANSHWALPGDSSMGTWSAVGYFFACELADKLGVYVGIVGCNWGGTSASAWMDRASLLEAPETRSYIDEYDEAVNGKTVTEQIAEYDSYREYESGWEKRAEECSKTNPNMKWADIIKQCGECKWPGPMGCKNPFRPSGLYECMLSRIAPYTSCGVIWYQGESDDHKPLSYKKLFTKMISVWRRDFKDPNLPFMFVQLPMHRYENDPDFKNWPIIREAQEKISQSVNNTGMAIISDYSEFNEIHPKKKQPVGKRLAMQAFFHVYHIVNESDAMGPMYDSHTAKENFIILSFKFAEDGFYVKSISQNDSTSDSDFSIPLLEGFEIAGEDKVFVPASASIDGSQILVHSDLVPNPLYVRYCWTNYSHVNIFGKRNAIPLAPFRTSKYDDSNVSISSGAIHQIMEI